MSLDVTELSDFYNSALGMVARRLVLKSVERIWPHAYGQSILGFGYATPYLMGLRTSAERVIAFMPSNQGIMAWPRTSCNATALVDRQNFPLQIGSVDRVIIVHGLETTDSPQTLMEEIWRVLTPGGRIIIVVPNRRGLWTRMDTTPFGQGQPFSRSQLSKLMQSCLFMPTRWEEALYIPPVSRPLALRSAHAWERISSGLRLPFAGVHVMEAVKQLYRPITAHQTKTTARLSTVLIPASSLNATALPPDESCNT